MTPDHPIPLITFSHRAMENLCFHHGIRRDFFNYISRPDKLYGLRRGTVVATYLPPDCPHPRWLDEAIAVARCRGYMVEDIEDMFTPHKDACYRLARQIFDLGVGEGPVPAVDRVQCRADEAEARILSAVGLSAPVVDRDARRVQAWREHYDKLADEECLRLWR